MVSSLVVLIMYRLAILIVLRSHHQNSTNGLIIYLIIIFTYKNPIAREHFYILFFDTITERLILYSY